MSPPGLSCMEIHASSLLRSVILLIADAALAVAVFTPSTGRAQAGSEDGTFQPPQFNSSIESISLDPNTGLAVVGGAFSQVYNATTNSYASVAGVARLAANGQLDPSFMAAALSAPNTNSFAVNAVAVQSDSKVIVGGNFILNDAVPHQGIARLLSNGQPDVADQSNLGTGVDSSGGEVFALAIQPDGRILVGGDFTSFNGAAASGLIRLNADLTRDESFVPDPTVVGYAGDVNKIVVQPDGAILISNQGSRPYRLTSSGTLDASFDPSGVLAATGADGFDTVTGGLALQPNGQVLAVLDFVTSPPNAPYTFAASVVRLNGNGTLDTTFDYSAKIAASDPSETPSVDGILPQPAGTVAIAGDFVSVGGQPRTAVARLQPNGLLDGSFDTTVFTGAFPTAVTLAYQEGYLLVGANHPFLIRLNDLNSSTPAFFGGEVALGEGVYYLQFANGDLFGYYSFLSDPHYLYHFDLGYEYVFDAADGDAGVYFYDFKSSTFFYTSPVFPFPYLYDFTLNLVLYYYPDTANPGHYTSNPRYFFNFATGQIITK